jgi:hypothetical protein
MAAADQATDTDAQVAELSEQVSRLQHEIQQLKASARGEEWLTEERAEEIRGLVSDVLADADTRASLLANGVTAGYDDGFFMGSSDGNFRLEIGGQVQFRWVYNTQEMSAEDDHRWGFENRRTKVAFEGHVFDPSWEYLVQGAFDRSDGLFVLEDAEITKDLGNGMYVRLGQFKPPFMREELVSSKRQLAVERSLLNEEFNQDRAQGVELGWEGEAFRVMGMYHDGFGTDNTAALAYDTEFAATGRAEFLAAGDWSQFKDFTSKRGSEPGVLVGGAIHFEEDEYGTVFPLETETFALTGDISIEFDGANVFGAIVYRNVETGLSEFDQWAFVVQGGYYFTDEIEGFVRYEYGDADDAGEDLNVITVGANYYIDGHRLKWQNDVGIGLDEVSSIWASSSAGWRTDTTGEDTQLVFRSQFQLLF